jgi:hypothetical protein
MANPKPKNEKLPKRVKNIFMTREMHKHARKIGEIVVAWNLLHITIFLLFEHYMGKEKKDSAKNMWNSLTNDTAQRNLFKSLLQGIPSDPTIEEISWMLTETEYLAQFRNSYAHVAVIVDHEKGKLTAARGNKEKYVKNLKIIGDKKLFIPLRNDICKLQDYALFFNYALSHGYIPEPDRPTLEVAVKFGRNGPRNIQSQTPLIPVSLDQSSEG